MGRKPQSTVNGATGTQADRDRKIIDETLYFVAQRGWTKADGDFLTVLCRYLAQTMDVAYVFVGQTIGEPPTEMETLALIGNGESLANIRYSLKDTPCENVSKDSICCYPHGIQAQFPNDELLVDLGADSYIGTPLWDSRGQVIGLIAMMDTAPLTNPALGNTLLQIVAMRVAAEVESRQSQEQLTRQQQLIHATFENAGVGIAHVAPNGDVLLANWKLCDLLGYSAEELQQKNIRDITYPGDIEKSFTSMKQALEAPPHLRGYTREKRYVSAKGRIIWSLITVTLVRDAQGAPDYFVTIIEDITHRKRHEEQLRQARDEAERANRAKSTFLANMSHELRTPLNAILGFAEMMDEQIHGEIPEKYKSYSSHIRSSGQHLLDLINEILDLSRIEMGRLELEITDCNLPAVAQEVMELLTIKAHLESVTLTLETTPKEFPPVRLDHMRIRQVLTNLAHNAIKFSPGGKVAIKLQADEQATSISVSDSGIGMTEQDIAVALSLFGQVENDYLSRKSEGTGLGLPLAKQLIELQGGTMSIRSQPGQGTTVTARFPVAREK